MLGGRAAELVVFGAQEVTQGASSDLQTVARLAREMVTRFGFSSLGPVALESANSEVFLGKDWFNQRPDYAETTGREIDSQVRALAQRSLEQAVALLQPRRQVMDRLVEALIDEETLPGERFMQLAGLT